MTTEGTPTEPTEPTNDDTVDWKAEAEKWKGLADTTDKRAKRLEDTAKANAAAAKELDQLRQSTMSDQEKAVAQARTEARTETLREVAADRVADKFRALAVNRPLEIDALLEGIDTARFANDDGTPDVKAIGTYLDKVAPIADEPDPIPFKRDLGAGVRGQQTPALNSDPLLRDLKAKLGI